MKKTVLVVCTCLATVVGLLALNSGDALNLHGDSLVQQQEKIASQATQTAKTLMKSNEIASKIDESAGRIRSGDKGVSDVRTLARDFSTIIQKMEGEREELAARNE